MTSEQLKVKVIHYLRVARTMPYIATECGKYSADILALGNELVEVETKISISDLRAEKKKEKHQFYSNPELLLSGLDQLRTWEQEYKKGQYFSIPDKFYFAVPENLAEKALKITEEFNSLYGLIIVSDEKLGPHWTGARNCVCVGKPAKKLISRSREFKKERFEELHRTITNRSSIEMINIWRKYNSLMYEREQ